MLSQKNETLSWTSISDGQGKQILTPMLLETAVFVGFSFLQCALLHPRFQHSASARWIRRSLGPLTIGWWLCYPFRSSIESRPKIDFPTGFGAGVMVFKTIDWTFATGPFHLRKYKTVDGVRTWEKEPAPKPEAEAEAKSKSKSESFDLGELILWTIMLFTSQRGLRWSWGPPGKGNTDSFAQSVHEMIRLLLVILPCVAFVRSSQDPLNHRVDPTSVLLNLGLPPIPGLTLLAECILSTACMLLISSFIELMSLTAVLFTHLAYPLAKTCGLPSNFTELVLNPANYPAQFGSLLDLSSVASFWGKSWHQKFRRSFLFCGGKPAMSLARYLGASDKLQKTLGVLAVFAVSGIFHEFPLYAVQKAPYPQPRALFSTFHGTFLYFFVQSFGVILEQFIIPRIPKYFGGAGTTIWTLSFLFLTAPLLTHDFFRLPIF